MVFTAKLSSESTRSILESRSKFYLSFATLNLPQCSQTVAYIHVLVSLLTPVKITFRAGRKINLDLAVVNHNQNLVECHNFVLG